MQRAVNHIIKQKELGNKILIFGYYDVDGVSSTESRKCIDSQGNIFSIGRSRPTPLLIGNINKQSGKICRFFILIKV